MKEQISALTCLEVRNRLCFMKGRYRVQLRRLCKASQKREAVDLHIVMGVIEGRIQDLTDVLEWRERIKAKADNTSEGE